MEFKDILPYIVSVLGSVIAGFWSYFQARKQSKEEINKLVKQHELEIDKLIKNNELEIEKEKERFKNEKEKMEIEHKYQIEMKTQEMQNNMGKEFLGTLFSEKMKNPTVQKRLEESITNSINKKVK